MFLYNVSLIHFYTFTLNRVHPNHTGTLYSATLQTLLRQNIFYNY